MRRPAFLLQQRARAISQGWWTSRLSPVPQPRLEHLPMDTPGSIFLEDFGIRFDNTFLLLLHGLFFSFAFCFRVHVSISTSTVLSAGFFFYGTCVYMYTTQSFFGFSFFDTIMTHQSNKRNTNQVADWKKIQQQEQSVQEKLTPFLSSSSSPFFSHFDTHFFTPR